MTHMPTAPSQDPLIAHTGDPDGAALLRRNLTAIADDHGGTPLGRAVRQVLSGEQDLSALERNPEFMALVRTGVRAYTDHMASLDPEERSALYAQAQEIVDAEPDEPR